MLTSQFHPKGKAHCASYGFIETNLTAYFNIVISVHEIKNII